MFFPLANIAMAIAGAYAICLSSFRYHAQFMTSVLALSALVSSIVLIGMHDLLETKTAETFAWIIAML